jgi:hypothetical protein
MSGYYARDDSMAWKKPEWTKKKPVRNTEQGAQAKTAGNLAAPITNIKEQAEEKGIGWQKPAWAKEGAQLKSTAKGEKLKTKGDLARPITFPKGKN